MWVPIALLVAMIFSHIIRIHIQHTYQKLTVCNLQMFIWNILKLKIYKLVVVTSYLQITWKVKLLLHFVLLFWSNWIKSDQNGLKPITMDQILIHWISDNQIFLICKIDLQHLSTYIYSFLKAYLKCVFMLCFTVIVPSCVCCPCVHIQLTAQCIKFTFDTNFIFKLL